MSVIYFGLKYADVRKITVFVVEVETVAYDKFIGDSKSGIFCCKGYASARRLVKQRADFYAFR